MFHTQWNSNTAIRCDGKDSCESVDGYINAGGVNGGNIYASATIFSSLLLIWVGKKIDEYQIIYYSFFVIFLLFFSSLFFSFIKNIY